MLFERARERAAALDAELAQTKRLKGALHGVPISVKVGGRCICFGLDGIDEFVVSDRINVSVPSPVFPSSVDFVAAVDIEGVDTTIGFSQWAKHGPATRDADVSPIAALYEPSS